MALRKFDRMDVEEYLLWESKQEFRHELVDGVPQMMVGATIGHDTVKTNATLFLGNKLRGSRCRVHSSDVKIRCLNDNIRYPDITIACGPVVQTDLMSSDPRVVFEVLSPSTRTTDFLIELRDYKTIPTLTAYVILWQDEPRSLVYRRTGEGWIEEEIGGMYGIIALPEIDIALPLGEVYEGLPPVKPRSRSRK
jgi:Uma2 family endonuclease